jgi:hypothetical protein
MATSRTADGKHTKRFIVLKKNSDDVKFVRSFSIPGFFETRELAQAQIDKVSPNCPNVQFKVRQK